VLGVPEGVRVGVAVSVGLGDAVVVGAEEVGGADEVDVVGLGAKVGVEAYWALGLMCAGFGRSRTLAPFSAAFM
jgi:hypothetical protein